MDHHVVDRNTGRRGESVKAQEGRLRAAFHDVIVHSAVDLPGGHAGLDDLLGDVQCVGGDPACLFHLLQLGMSFQNDHESLRLRIHSLESQRRGIGDFLLSFYHEQFACGVVVILQGLCLLVVYAQTLFDGIGMVVLALNGLSAAGVAHARLFAGLVIDVVGSAALSQTRRPDRRAMIFSSGTSMSMTRSMADLHFIQRLCLGHRAGEAVQDEAVFAVIPADALPQDVDDDLVRDQLAAVHVRFRLQAQSRLIFDCFTQNVSGGDRGDVQGVADDFRLCALTRARVLPKE